MRSSRTSRSLWLAGVVAVCCGFPGQPLPAAEGPGLQTCVDRLRTADLEEQQLCLRRLKGAGPDAAVATQALCDLLTRSDGATNHVLIASALDVLRSLGPRAAPAAETLSGLLPHRSKLYTGRDKLPVVRLRAYIVVTLSEIGFPSSALPALLDSLAHVDERMNAMEAGAAARAVRALGPSGCSLAPYLLDALNQRVGEEEFSLERYEPQFPPHEATTIQLEAVRSLGEVCAAKDLEVVTALRELAGAHGQAGPDPRVAREAQRALENIQKGHGERR